MKFVILFSVVFLGLLIYIASGVAMELFSKKKEEVILFSPMEGVLTINGVPASGVRLGRVVNWDGDKESVVSIDTSNDGFFSFDELKEDIEISPLNVFVVNQYIYAYHENKAIKIWIKAKWGKELYSELGGKPKNLRCELMDPLVRVELESGALGTRCKWDSIEK